MAVKSWHENPRDIEHDNSQTLDIARRSTVAKRGFGPAPIHPGMSNRTNTTLGAPPTGAPPDASSPLPTDPDKQHGSKSFPVPACHPHMKSDPERGSYDPQCAGRVMGNAHSDGKSDFARSLHATLPSETTEE